MDSMKIPVARQLLLFAGLLTFLALLIGVSAFVSWREIRELRGGLTTAQLESFRIADQLQAGLLRLGSHLLKYEYGRRPKDWRSFEDESRRLDAWIDEQKTALTTPEEKAVLSEINAVYDGYLAAASEIAAGAASLDRFEVEIAEILKVQRGFLACHGEELCSLPETVKCKHKHRVGEDRSYGDPDPTCRHCQHRWSKMLIRARPLA
jgi:hypothetical protein